MLHPACLSASQLPMLQTLQPLNMTQALFANMIGISKKTVEAWESGRNIPMGPASRELDLLAEDKFVAGKFVVNG